MSESAVVRQGAARHAWKQRRLQNFDYSDPDHAYFVTIRALPGTAPFTGEALAKKVVESIMWMREHRGVAVYAYCLMPDHVHLLIRLGRDGRPLGDDIGAFKRFTTRQSWPLGYKGALWQRRFYDHVVRKSEDGAQICLYILENPVRKGLVTRSEVYPYSGHPDPM